MTALDIDEARLDDVPWLERADPGRMLRAVATSAAQVRESALRAAEAGITTLSVADRPRAVVVTGMGGSGISGDVLGGVTGLGCPVPVLTHRGYGLPGWVGAADLVIAVSCSGRTEETLSAAEEALRRGARLVAVGAPDSPLAERAEQGRALFVEVQAGDRLPRSMMWALATPLVLLADALGLAHAPAAALEATAARLEEIAQQCRPTSETFVNPAKTLAVELAGSLPLVWGSSPLTAVVAHRFSCQLAENAKYPAIAGALPEADHNQVVTFDGPFAGDTGGGNDFFRDRVDDADGAVRLRLLLLRDVEEHPQVARRAVASREIAEARGVPVTELRAQGDSAYERLSSLVGLLDFASVYQALLLGIDPTPITAIQELKARIAE